MEIPTMFLVESLGRKPLFIASEFMTSLSVFVIGAYFYILNNDPATAATLGWLPLTALLFFIAFLSAGIQPLAWVVSNEVLPARFRGPGSSIAAFTNWLSMFIATKTFVNMQISLTSAGTFWVYGCFCSLFENRSSVNVSHDLACSILLYITFCFIIVFDSFSKTSYSRFVFYEFFLEQLCDV